MSNHRTPDMCDDCEPPPRHQRHRRAHWADHDALGETIFTMLGHSLTRKYIPVSTEGWVAAAAVSHSLRGTRCAASVEDVVLAASASNKLAVSQNRKLVRRQPGAR